MKGKNSMIIVSIIFSVIFFLIAFFLIYQVVKGKQKRLGTYIMIVICLFVAVMFLYLVLTNQFQQINYNVPTQNIKTQISTVFFIFLSTATYSNNSTVFFVVIHVFHSPKESKKMRHL